MARASGKKPTLPQVIARLDRIETLLTEQREYIAAASTVASHSELTKLLYHDVTKGLIGSIFGVIGYFAFFAHHPFGETMTALRATLILMSGLILLTAYVYFSGYKNGTSQHRQLPVRVFALYGTALVVSLTMLFLFSIIQTPLMLEQVYFQVCAVSVLAVMGTVTADMCS